MAALICASISHCGFSDGFVASASRSSRAPLQLTSLQRSRLIQLLLAHDVQELGGGPREIATEALGSLQATLPSVEWKDSAARRHANRLIRDARALVNGGYLRLLRGK